MAVGAYTCAIPDHVAGPEGSQLRPAADRSLAAHVRAPFVPALLLGGVIAGFIGWLLGVVALRLRDDYLAIATLGFSEIIRVVLTNLQTVTNGSLGLKGFAALHDDVVGVGFGDYRHPVPRAADQISLRPCVPGDPRQRIAAESMGVNVFGMKVLSFTISSFLAGIAGGLLARTT